MKKTSFLKKLTAMAATLAMTCVMAVGAFAAEPAVDYKLDSASISVGETWTMSVPAGGMYDWNLSSEYIAYGPSENVYFLNTVTVDDLLPLAEQGKEPPKEVTPEPEPKPTEPVEEVPEPEPEKKDSPLLSLLLIGAVVLAGGGIGYYFKIYKPKHEAPDLEDDYCEYEDGELEEIAEEPEDEDTPPWEEDTEE